jgi:hypothetical protein
VRRLAPAGAVPEVAEPEVARMAAELPAKVDHGVLTGEDPAKRSLAGCRLEAAEAPDHAGISSGLPVSCRWSP